MYPDKQGLYSPEFEHENCGAGFICSLKGEKTNSIIGKALNILVKLEHRGAVSADGKTGDGAGILIEIPHEFFSKTTPFKLPNQMNTVGMVFLPQKKNQRDICINIFEKKIEEKGLKILGWRKVPVNKKVVGKIASKTEPYISQVFISKGDEKINDLEFNVKLFCARKKCEHEIYNSKFSESNFFYFCSLSTKTIIYKGLLVPEDIELYYKDLKDPKLVTRLALVHQRFSTNTFPLGTLHNHLDICAIMVK